MKNKLYSINKIPNRQTVKEYKNNKPAKRINVVSIKMVKEDSILYKERKINK